MERKLYIYIECTYEIRIFLKLTIELCEYSYRCKQIFRNDKKKKTCARDKLLSMSYPYTPL